MKDKRTQIDEQKTRTRQSAERGKPPASAPEHLGEDGEKKLLGKLAVFSGVSEFPMRVKCASLSWHAL